MIDIHGFEGNFMNKKIILMIDDVQLNHEAARAVLEDTYELYEALSAKAAFDILKKIMPDLILLDIVMPEIDGYEMLRLLKKSSKFKNIPVIFLTADTRPETEVEGFNGGIVDYITKPFVPIVMKKRIETQIALAEYERSLEEKVTEKVEEIESMYDLITTSFAGLVESRDGVTGGHLKNTAIYFSAFISHLQMLDKYKEQLTPQIVKKACRSAPLHDVGKIAIEDAVLRKAGSLSEEEFEKMKLHSVIGGDIFRFIKKRIPDKEFGEVAERIARYHHEKWNGKGYPEGLEGTDIPLVARIMSIVDVYDALTSERPYKKPFSHEKSMAIIVSKSGTDFDPELVTEFVNIGNKIKECLLNKEEVLIQQNFFSFDTKGV
ncbi:MAG: response regulator [Lachnospiraceae bacterium]|nr:response regulator [Lachnospiraceae bacterium]